MLDLPCTADTLQHSGVLVGVPHYADIHKRRPAPSLHMCVTASLTDADISAVGSALRKAVQEVL